jgi:hypothetical protein
MMLPDYEITEEERDRTIEKWARKIVGKGLETPAILFLEMHKPLTFLASQGLLVGMPFLAPFIGVDVVHKYSKLLESRENIELLIRRIEELAADKEEMKGKAKNSGADGQTQGQP